ncbi:MAG: catalase family peroxidase [Methyloceanibacter sp.]|uniref:catalase family peroxidase n=1 Tax=Methyloceanibacter sp. TaxID=1965321 RepID=UPI003D9B2B81
MTIISLKRAAVSILSLVLLAGLVGEARAQNPTPVEMVDGLNAVFGKHPHTRAGHAKGFCVSGNFTPATDAASLSKAPQFTKPVPLLGRFSLGGGNPQAPDNAKGNPKGLALRFDLGDGATSDFVMISAPVFLAKTPALFLELLQAIASGDPEKPKAFFGAHPESTRQGAWLNARPVPASYAGVNYFGVHTFTLTNADGEQKIVKLKVIPKAGEEGLTDEEAEAKGPTFLEAELMERLGKGPVAFDLVAILGQDGDNTDDPTVIWEEEGRTKAPLGMIEIDALAPNEKCNAITFLPGNLPEGTAGPANDPIFAMRSPAYLVSFSRRTVPAP